MLLEAVPNLSLGPDAPALVEVLGALEAQGSPGWALLDVHSDVDHARTVLTMAGAPVPLLRALRALVDACALHGDLRTHEGGHPRVGLVDVVPLVALAGAEQVDAARVARQIAAHLARRGVPVYHYADLVPPPRKVRLADLRRALADRFDPSVDLPTPPDLGPPRLHPRLGAACVGTRGPLVAYNVLLDTTDLSRGATVASAVRERDGGLVGVQALAFPLAHEGGRIQVSMNLTRPDQTGLARAYEAVRHEARRLGAETIRGELVGLAPAIALQAHPDAMGLDEAPRSLETLLRVRGLLGTGTPRGAGDPTN